jgi:hypothetical protein
VVIVTAWVVKDVYQVGEVEDQALEDQALEDQALEDQV